MLWTGPRWCLLSLLVVSGGACAATINLVSGNGTIGNPDAEVHFLLGPSASDFAVFTATDFTNAQSGPFAEIITPNVFWNSGIAGAQWNGDNVSANSGGNTDLYAISFTLPAFSSASISFNYQVDNTLGGSNNPALFLNGMALGLAGGSGGFGGAVNTYSQSGIEGLLQVGTNWLYIDDVNGGGPSGLLFSATITTVDSAGGTPEPGTIGLTALGAVVLFSRLRRSRR